MKYPIMEEAFDPTLEKLHLLAVVFSQHPHIYDRICLFWGTAEISPYFDGLFMSDRPTPRLGFKIEVLMELQHAISEHVRLFPHLHPEATCPFRAVI